MRESYNIFKSKQLLGKKPVSKGDIILKSEPFVYVVDYLQRGKYCDNCLVSNKDHVLKSCDNCNQIMYCGDSCIMEGQQMHEFECRALKRTDPYVPPNFARLLLRLIFKLKRVGDTYAESFGTNKSRKFKDLMNHYRDIKADETRLKDVRNLRKILSSLIGKHNIPEEVDFIGMYGRILVNRFCLMDDLLCPIGSAVYLAGSIFDHSCLPNAYPSFEGKKLVIRSLVDSPQLDFNKVNISYIDPICTTNQRRQELRTNWYFWCECSVCNDKERHLFENSIMCENPECKAPVQLPERAQSIFAHTPGPTPECQICGWEVTSETLTAYHSAVAYTRQRLKTMKEESPSVEVCWNILEKQGDIFSKMNVWRVRTVDFLFNAAFNRLVCLTAIEKGGSNLDAFKYYYGNDHPTLGLYYMKMAKVLMYVREFREGLSYVEEAKRILTISLGAEHLLVKEELSRLWLIASEDIQILLERRMLAHEQKTKKGKHLICTPKSIYPIQTH